MIPPLSKVTSSLQPTAGQIDDRSRGRGGPVRGQESRSVAHVGQGRHPPQQRPLPEKRLDLLGWSRPLAGRSAFPGLRDPLRTEAVHADAVRPDLSRKLLCESFDRRARDPESPNVDAGEERADGRGGECQDYARALPDHAPRRRPGCQKMRRRACADRTHEIFAGHLDERDQLYVLDRDGVEGDIYAPRSLHHLADVLLDDLLVQSVDLRRLSHASSRGYVLGYLLERCDSASSEEDPCSPAGESTGHRTAYLSSTPVDHRVLALEQHVHPPVCWILSGPEPKPLRNRLIRPGSFHLSGVRPVAQSGRQQSPRRLVRLRSRTPGGSRSSAPPRQIRRPRSAARSATPTGSRGQPGQGRPRPALWC